MTKKLQERKNEQQDKKVNVKQQITHSKQCMTKRIKCVIFTSQQSAKIEPANKLAIQQTNEQNKKYSNIRNS